MVSTHTLADYLKQTLDPSNINDYSPNGLQVEGKKSISTIVTGVTACAALLEKAVELKADAILVHHGYFWKGENPCLIGMKKDRVKILLKQNVNLFSYHLPLDIHMTYGNNVQLAKKLGIFMEGQLDIEGVPLVAYGRFESPMQSSHLKQHIQHCLGRISLHVEGVIKQEIETVAWCTGAGQSFIDIVAEKGFDAYITGEVSERTTHVAREAGIHFYSAGHHATERYGIEALGEHLADQFGLQHYFVDIDNPV